MPFKTPLLLKYAEADKWLVGTDFIYFWERKEELVIVPKGYKTDLASVPDIVLPIIVNDTGRIARAAVVHDYGYTHLSKKGWSKRKVDLLFRDAMTETGMPKWRVYLAWAAVRMNLVASYKWPKNIL